MISKAEMNMKVLIKIKKYYYSIFLFHIIQRDEKRFFMKLFSVEHIASL